jgi:hypothetical protein
MKLNRLLSDHPNRQGTLGPVVTDDTPPAGSAKPELEGYEGRESVEVRNDETPPPTAPSVADDTTPTGDSTPELEGYDSKESTRHRFLITPAP